MRQTTEVSPKINNLASNRHVPHAYAPPCPTYCLVIIHTEAFEVLDEAPLEVATATGLDCCVHKPLYADRDWEAKPMYASP